jgi:hypothetical protein
MAVKDDAAATDDAAAKAASPPAPQAGDTGVKVR